AGAGRALDEEIAAVERGGARALLADVGRLDRPAGRAGQPRPRPRHDVLERAIASVARPYGLGQPCEGAALLGRGDRPARDEPGRRRHRGQAGPPPQLENARGVVELLDRARALARGRVDRDVALPELVLLRGEAELLPRGPAVRTRRTERLEAADGLAVLHQLVGGHGAAGVEPPPRGARLAAVILEQLGDEPARRAGLGAGEQRLAQRLALGVARLALLVGGPLVGRQGPGRRGRPV